MKNIKYTNESFFTKNALDRLKNPSRRGKFQLVDAARKQLGLLTVADDFGQCCVYALLDMEKKTIEDARFLAFGELYSHPIADAFCDVIRGGTNLGCLGEHFLKRVDDLLADKEGERAFDEEIYSFINNIIQVMLAKAPFVVVPPKPKEVEKYARKREQDWDDTDKKWLPLSLLRKISAVQKEIKVVLKERIEKDLKFSVDALNEDFLVTVKIEAEEDEKPTIQSFINSSLQNAIHPLIKVTVK